MSEEELNEAMQYNLDYTEAMLNDELFGTNEVAEVKLLASEKTIKDLQQKIEQLENIIKEAIEYINKMWLAKLTPDTVSNTKFDLLNILNKGENNGE